MLTLILVGLLAQDWLSAAIKQGQEKRPQVAVEVGSNSAGQYVIQLRGPYLRVVSHTVFQTRKLLPVTPESLSADLIQPGIDVTVTPGNPIFRPYIGWDVTPPASHVAIQMKSGETIQPTSVTPFPWQWTSNAGAPLQSQGLTATFPALPAGDFDIVVVTPTEPYRKTVKGKDRQALR